MANPAVKRAVRVARQVHERIAAALQRDVADWRLVGVVVTRVEMPDDLQLAHLWIRLTSGDAPAARKQALAGLAAAAPRLRRMIGQGLELRRTPDLRFSYDEGQDAAVRVDELLREIALERDGDREADAAPGLPLGEGEPKPEALPGAAAKRDRGSDC